MWLEASRRRRGERPARQQQESRRDDGGDSGDECKREACGIQACLKKNDHQQKACQGAILALRSCCRRFRDSHGHSNTHCAAIRLDNEQRRHEAPRRRLASPCPVTTALSDAA